MKLKIIVRAKRDSDAVKATIRTFYPDWNISVSTVKGIRDPWKALEKISELIDPLAYNIVLVGLQESSWREVEEKLPPNAVVHIVKRSKVRNARIEMIYHEIERAKAVFRNHVEWNNTYILYPRIKPLIREAYNPAFDVYLAYGEGFHEALGSLTDKHVPLPLLVYKGLGASNYLFYGPIMVGELHIPDTGKPWLRVVKEVAEEYDVDLKSILRENADVIRVYENIAVENMKNVSGEYDRIFVPWSGGKDSTAAVILSKKAFGGKKMKAVFVDTGVDFPFNIEYVEKTSKILGVGVVVTYSGVREGLREHGLPTHDNRWCTKYKIKALYNCIRDECSRGDRVLIVVGDRDAESLLRGKRPFTRSHEEFHQIAPLKMWSGLQVQLYLTANNIPSNPLYEEGFYRIGCYICPALRSWEVMIMTDNSRVWNKIRGLPCLREFLDYRLRSTGEFDVEDPPSQ